MYLYGSVAVVPTFDAGKIKNLVVLHPFSLSLIILHRCLSFDKQKFDFLFHSVCDNYIFCFSSSKMKILIFAAVLFQVNSASGRSKRQLIGQLQDPDFGRTTEQLILSRGFEYEFHSFIVPDGFVIGIHRIINPYRSPAQTKGTVLFLHGITGSTNNYLDTNYGGNVLDPPGVLSPNLGFEVARAGFDVWLMDQRATPYSSNNTKYNPLEPEYWNWSLDQMAFYDLPGAIEYVRSHTGRKQIGFIAHSQGNQVMFFLLSRVPKYNNIIKPFVALAPIFHLADSIFTRSALLRLLPYDELQSILARINGPILTAAITGEAATFCQVPVIQQLVCDPLVYTIYTFFSFLIIPTPPSINPFKLPVYASSSLLFTVSSKQLAQQIQSVVKNRPSMLDLTPEDNMKMYGSAIPPTYDAGKITNQYIALFSAINDVLGDPKDVEQLREQLPVRPIYDEVISDPAFGHSTFILGDSQRVVKFVTRPVLALLDSLY